MKFLQKDSRPWGQYFVVHDEKSYKLKRIEVKPGQRISYQFHKKRSETWTIVKGSGVINLDGIEKNVKYGDTITISKKVKHRIYNNTNSDLIFIEVQTGSYFGEDDIIRIEDDYKRV